ncbi:MAG: iron export ABC transporter permease subunit FetB [Aquificae bacterium]|nr:iron export ABC transporter permease subunit FetB [Aquificota bacterium]
MEFKFLASYILVLVALFYSYKEKLGLEKTLLLSSLRAFFQLLILGYLLTFIFKLDKVWELFLVLLFMIVFAAYTAESRVKLRENRGYLIAFLSVFSASFTVIFSLLSFGVISLKPNEIIPVGGMIIGNSLNVYTLFVERLKNDIKNSIETIENKIALGVSLRQALYPVVKSSIRASLIPVINTLQTVGIIHIPGVTTGMLLAGAEPLEAVSYQLAIMYMMVAVALFTGIFTNMYLFKLFFKGRLRV